MNIEDIRKLAGIVKKSSLHVLEVTEGDFKVRIESFDRGYEPPEKNEFTYHREDVPQEISCVPQVEETTVDFNNIEEIKAPMVGVFYEAPAPGEEPFVKPGSKVKKGDVLCIIEAMKLMNEITAAKDGEIVDVCVENGAVVEYGQALFKIC